MSFETGRRRIINVSYQLSKMNLFPFFTGVLILLVIGSCRPVQPMNSMARHAEKLFASGEFSRLETMHDSVKRLGNLIPADLILIDSLNELGHRISLDFPLSEEDVSMQLKKYYPEPDSVRIRNWERSRKLEMRILNGEKRYFKNAVSNLFRLDDEARKRKIEVLGLSVDSLDLFCLEHTRKVVASDKTQAEPVLPVLMTLRYTVSVKPNVVPDGETIRCWMPFPREGNVRQQKIKLLKSDPEIDATPENDIQRAVYLEKKAQKDQPTTFRIEFEVETAAQYFDLKPENIKPYQTESAVYKEYTRERAPQILFTENIRRLGDRILAGETNPLTKVQKIYNWINDSIRWASALEYSTIPNIPEYVLETRHGDCGMQTLLFMTLARSQGIPVKWQSGWMLHPRVVNLHDWCEVNYEGIGWVPLDQSFGLQSTTDEKVRNFYRSGIDSYRLIVNDDYARELSPKKKYSRSEPYDFQRGELEWEGGNLYFDQWNWHMDVESIP